MKVFIVVMLSIMTVNIKMFSRGNVGLTVSCLANFAEAASFELFKAASSD
jgi:hypothetical protein